MTEEELRDIVRVFKRNIDLKKPINPSDTDWVQKLALFSEEKALLEAHGFLEKGGKRYTQKAVDLYNLLNI